MSDQHLLLLAVLLPFAGAIGVMLCDRRPNVREAVTLSTAAAVLNSDGMAIAAVQIPVYMPNWTIEEAKKKIMPLVIETARSISGLI